ncbi:MAG: hypothetical protein V7603_3179 [Micromonosporaceae bacterium]
MDRQRGVYFIANDFILDRAIAFLNSFRRYNTSIPLCLIPYADDIDRLAALRDRYDFDIWADSELLDTCDEISRTFHGVARTERKYRKLATWEGAFDEFAYFDCDTVVLHDVSFVFRYLDQYAFITGYANSPGTRHLVWEDSIYETGALTEEQIAYAAGTGFVASRKEHLPFAEVQRRLPAAQKLAPHMYLETCDQPLLNYLMVTSGLPYTSLNIAAAANGASDVAVERWGGLPIGEIRDGAVVSPESPPTLFVHWAGLWYRNGTDLARIPGADLSDLPNYELWRYYRDQPVG